MNLFCDKDPNILNKFLLYLFNIKNYSIRTISEYRIDLLVFFKYIKNYCNIKVDIAEFNSFILLNVKESDIISFIVYLNYNRNCTASTRKRKICAIKAFYKWLTTFYPSNNISNPAEDLPSIQDIRKLPKYLTFEQAQKINNIFDSKNSKFPTRNNTIITLFLNCGLRASELININLCDINLNKNYIKIIGKGNKERICYLNNNTKIQIEKYLEIRNKDKKLVDLKEPLFLSYRKSRLKLNTVEAITKNAYNLAGMGDLGYTTHTLRHTTATIIYQYTKSDILVLKEILGHSTIQSTKIYTHVHNEEIKKAVNSNPLSDYTREKIA